MAHEVPDCLKSVTNEALIQYYEIAKAQHGIDRDWWKNLDAVFNVALKHGKKYFPKIAIKDDDKKTAENYMRRWVEKYVKATQNRPSKRIAEPKSSCNDPMVRLLIQTLKKYSDTEMDSLTSIHNLFMSAENIQGKLLEEYISENISKYGFIWCEGEVLSSIDFCNTNGTLLLQVKNKDNTENSSSDDVRDYTDIIKWNRLNTKSLCSGRIIVPDTENNWKKINKYINENKTKGIDSCCCLSEEGYQLFLKKIINSNPDIITDKVQGEDSDITEKVNWWLRRKLDEIYPVVFIEAVHFLVWKEGTKQEVTAFVTLGINQAGQREVLTILVGKDEDDSDCISLLNELKNRGVKDILLLCADELAGIKEAIQKVFPRTEYQRCLIHEMRSSLNNILDEDIDAFLSNLKIICYADNEQEALGALETAAIKWNNYPNVLSRWKEDWEAIKPIFMLSKTAREKIFDIKKTERINSKYQELNKNCSAFPNEMTLLKALCIETFDITKQKSWKENERIIAYWDKIYSELAKRYKGRLPDKKNIELEPTERHS